MVDLYGMMERSSLEMQAVYAIQGLMSVISWFIIIYKSIQLPRERRRASQDMASLEATGDLSRWVWDAGRDPSVAGCRIASAGLAQRDRLMLLNLPPAGKAQVVLDGVRDALWRETEAQIDRVFGKLPYLGAFANAGPLFGLFGTVWGVMDSFGGFVEVKSMSLSALGPGLAEALATTAVGLIVAIPASLAYNYFLVRLRGLESEFGAFAMAVLTQVQVELAEEGRPASRPEVEPQPRRRKGLRFHLPGEE